MRVIGLTMWIEDGQAHMQPIEIERSRYRLTATGTLSIELEGLEAGVWFGIAAPAGTPAPIVAKLNAAINKVVEDTGVRERLAKVDIIAQGSTPEELGTLFERQSVTWATTLKRAGVKPE